MRKSLNSPVASFRAMSTRSTCDRREPFFSSPSNARSCSSSPSPTKETVPSSSFQTSPTTPSEHARRTAKSRYMTTCTRPDILASMRFFAMFTLKTPDEGMRGTPYATDYFLLLLFKPKISMSKKIGKSTMPMNISIKVFINTLWAFANPPSIEMTNIDKYYELLYNENREGGPPRPKCITVTVCILVAAEQPPNGGHRSSARGNTRRDTVSDHRPGSRRIQHKRRSPSGVAFCIEYRKPPMLCIASFA